MKKAFALLFFLLPIFLFVSSVQANTYGSGEYGSGKYGFGNEELFRNGGGSSTTSNVQFDIKILDIDSPLKIGEDFDFTYFIKGVGNINNDVVIDFWIEKDGEVITSGSDAIFMANNEEKTETANLFLPTSIESGIYQFNIKVSFDSINAESHRTVELTKNYGVTEIDQLFDIGFSLDDITIENSNELSALVIFENFGTQTTTINLTFIIFDELEKERHREEDSIIVETKELLKKSFKELNLPKGKYFLVLQTLYNTNISDEFVKDFRKFIDKFGLWLRHIFR